MGILATLSTGPKFVSRLPPASIPDGYRLDCILSYSQPSTVRIPGLSHSSGILVAQWLAVKTQAKGLAERAGPSQRSATPAAGQILRPLNSALPHHTTPHPLFWDCGLCGLLVLTVLKAERGPGAEIAMWPRAPRPRQRWKLAKPPSQTYLAARTVLPKFQRLPPLAAGQSRVPARETRASSGGCRRAVGERSCGAAASSPLSSGRAGRTSRGGNFPGTGIRLGPRRRQRRGLRAGWPPDQRSRPAEPGPVRERRGAPWGGRGGETSGPLTSLADRCSPAARTGARAPAAPREVPARLDGACAAARTPARRRRRGGRERASEPGGSGRAASQRHDAATGRPSAAPARLDAAGRAAGHWPRVPTEEARSRAPRPLEDGGGE